MNDEPIREADRQDASQPGSDAKREVREFIKMIAWFLLLFFTLKQFVIEGYEVQGPSMEPTLVDKERILVFKLPHQLSQWSWFSGIEAIGPGDIIVFDSKDDADKRYVKRVIAHGEPAPAASNTVDAGGLGNEDPAAPMVKVKIEDNRIFVNDVLREEPYLSDDMMERFHAEDYEILQPGAYYVLGDNRPVSKDSRTFGAIQDDDIIGRAVLRFWPPSRISILR